MADPFKSFALPGTRPGSGWIVTFAGTGINLALARLSGFGG